MPRWLAGLLGIFEESWSIIRQLLNEALTLAAFLLAAWFSQWVVGKTEAPNPTATISPYLDTQFLITLFEKAVFVTYLIRMALVWLINSVFDIFRAWSDRRSRDENERSDPGKDKKL